MSQVKEKLQEMKEYMRKIEHLTGAIGLIQWDMRVGAPRKAIPDRGEMLAYLAGEHYKLQTSDKMKDFIEALSGNEELDEVEQSMVANAKKEYDLTKKVPEERAVAYTQAVSDAEAAWEEAKDKNDFESFKPHLKKVIDFQKEFVEYYGYEGNKYNTMLDNYEAGITVERLDKIFSDLRDSIVELLNKIKNSTVKIDDSFFKEKFSKEAQKEFSLFVLEKMGYDFAAGRLDESVHPFTTNFGNKDVRITTKFLENEFRSALFSTIHEGGHGIYEQNVSDDLKGTGLAGGASMGIHESQSRFYENIIGRSRAFWKYFLPEAKKRFPQFENVDFEEFYRAINIVEPSLVRIEADELTYSLHIIIRYELEKALINNEITVEELPEAWNKKYSEYLGVEAHTYTEGVMQDTHWASGLFGYFPSYALGNLYGAQFLNKMLKDMPDMYEDIENGNLQNIYQWLKDNIHRHGAVYKPAELIKKVTGEELTSKYFVEYLNNKYSEIYNL
ncbi:carboxypeptidase M32 [Clostridium polynesiense]|uniref:carboxypeptidase M32 n=1 Tax=Clostridium polynesiense TaxID=1325933 RepID=UPI00059055C7|nr:carboxypeptidase M32 [Clostridium polynesiense]